jgi:predicted CoA-binding protein
MRDAINTFFSSSEFAVVGVSTNRRKFGNIVYRNMLEREFPVYPVNPKLAVAEDRKCFPSVLDLPDNVKSVVTVVPPLVTEEVLTDCFRKGVRAVWMQPGSESRKSIELARERNFIIVHGECIIIHLEPVKSAHALHRWVNKLVGVFPR